MNQAPGIVKIVVSTGRCPAMDDEGTRCDGRASELTQVKTQWGSTYIKACPFHADMMEDE